jgi:hypothetical protein
MWHDWHVMNCHDLPALVTNSSPRSPVVSLVSIASDKSWAPPLLFGTLRKRSWRHFLVLKEHHRTLSIDINGASWPLSQELPSCLLLVRIHLVYNYPGFCVYQYCLWCVSPIVTRHLSPGTTHGTSAHLAHFSTLQHTSTFKISLHDITWYHMIQTLRCKRKQNPIKSVLVLNVVGLWTVTANIIWCHRQILSSKWTVPGHWLARQGVHFHCHGHLQRGKPGKLNMEHQVPIM